MPLVPATDMTYGSKDRNRKGKGILRRFSSSSFENSWTASPPWDCLPNLNIAKGKLVNLGICYEPIKLWINSTYYNI